MNNHSQESSSRIGRWAPAIVVVLALLVAGAVYHRQLIYWFTGDHPGQPGSAHDQEDHPSASEDQPVTAENGAEGVATEDTGIAYYTCSMHPSVRSNDPGTCPICSMDLEPVTHEELRSGTITIDAQRRQMIGVRTDVVGEQELAKQIRAVGIVTWDETRLTDVTLKYRGWIGRVFADYTGKRVEEGEPLFEIYSPELFTAQQEYLDSLSSQRMGGLLESTRNRLLLWDMTESQINALGQRGKPQKYVSILSPATGTIIEKRFVAGSAVDAGQQLYRIVDLSSLWVEAELYESELAMIEEGQQVRLTVSYLPGRTVTGVVSYIYPYLDAQTRRGRVRIEVPNPDGTLKPQMYANVSFEASLGKRLVVPEDAILYGGKNNIVFLDLGEGRLRPQRIQTGVRAGPWVEVVDGLSSGDVIVTSGNFLIASESKLKSGIDQW